MFQFPGFPAYAYLIQYMLRDSSSRGFPHSEICGSKLICSSPQLIAACHVLRRLPMPRHSPYALLCLNYLEQVSLFSGSRRCFAWIAVFILAVSLAKLFSFTLYGKTWFLLEDFTLRLISCFPYFVCHVCHIHSFESIWSSLIRFSMNIRPCWALWILNPCGLKIRKD